MVVVIFRVKVPSPLLAHDMPPCEAVYPAGIAKVSTLAHVVAVRVAPGVAVGKAWMWSINVAVAGVHGPSVTTMVRVTGPPLLISADPKL